MALISGLLAACQSSAPENPIRSADYVDLDQFMGDWYVIGNIPTLIERNAYNAVESYKRKDEHTIDTTFSFNADGFDGKRKEYNPTGFVREDPSNAIWGMQFIWPIKAEYIVVYVDPEYQSTIIGRTARDYLWIMARTPQIEDAEYNRLLDIAAAQGYDVSKVRKVPQSWD
ncbi:MAG: lipocalin family protein [Pseudomonadaceae bacterium]|nr:lipocalin family protein [Pseudomonadaceae bacterium]